MVAICFNYKTKRLEQLEGGGSCIDLSPFSHHIGLEIKYCSVYCSFCEAADAEMSKTGFLCYVCMPPVRQVVLTILLDQKGIYECNRKIRKVLETVTPYRLSCWK